LNQKKAWLLAAVIIGSLLLFWIARSVEERRLARVMNSQLQGKAAELDTQLTRFAVVPRLLAKNPNVIEALRINEPGKVNESRVLAANVTLSHAQLDSGAAFTFVLDLEGTTVAASNYAAEVSFVGVNYGFRPYFKHAIEGQESTFFAVGATTGVPGYFVANPVLANNTIVGVVVVKFELAGLFDSWKLAPYEWLAVDEFGVVILSTNPEYLYLPTRNLESPALEKIVSDRRYRLAEVVRFNRVTSDFSRIEGAEEKRSFFVKESPINVEEWNLQLMVDRSHINIRALIYLLALLAMASIIALVYRMLRAQKRLAEAEKRYTLQLERDVQQATDELRSAQQELISESNFAMLGRMSGAINHEINQPLASLRLNLAALRKMLDKPDSDPAEVRQIVLDSDRTTKRIGRVVTTLRNLTGQQRAEHSSVDIARLISEVIETLNRERPAMSHSLSVSVADNLSGVVGNEVLLQQALLNLIYNAFDAVIDEPDPLVVVTARDPSDTGDNTLVIEVSDNGCGVSDDIVSNLFKPFVSDKTRKSGLGLGLTLVDLIAKEHGGELKYQPLYDNEGVPIGHRRDGSLFSLTIPRNRYK